MDGTSTARRPELLRSHAVEPGVAVRQRVLVMPDAYRLPVVSWEPSGQTLGTVVALHAFGDFRLAFEEVGPALAARGFCVHAYDQRGFGDTVGHGRWHGYRRLVRDLRHVLDQLRPDDGSPLYLLGESLGGGVALVAAARFQPEGVAGLILVEPAVRRGVRWRLMWDVAVGALALLAPGYSRRLIRGSHPLATAAARRRLGSDPRIVRTIRADAYKGLLSLANAASAGSRRLRTPTLLLYGRGDGIIPLRLFEQAVRDLTPWVTAIRYPEAPHLLLQTLDWELVVEEIGAWIDGARLPVSGTASLLRLGPRPGLAPESASRARR
jgi:alpha-beta hydrolase superfamily lysophospholipase